MTIPNSRSLYAPDKIHSGIPAYNIRRLFTIYINKGQLNRLISLKFDTFVYLRVYKKYHVKPLNEIG